MSHKFKILTVILFYETYYLCYEVNIFYLTTNIYEFLNNLIGEQKIII